MSSESEVQAPSLVEKKSRKSRFSKQFFARVAIVFSVLILALFFFSLLGEYFFVAELIGNFRFQILVLLLPFMGLMIYFKRKGFVVTFAVAIAWASIGTLTVYLPLQSPPAEAEKLRILSFNVLGTNVEVESVQNRVREFDPDVMVILEYSDEWQNAFSVFEDTYPYQVMEPRTHGFGIALYSKNPLEDIRVHQLTPSEIDNPAIETTIDVSGQKVRLFGIHMTSPISPLRLRVRNSQFEELAEIIGDSDIPTLVAGDFNCTPWSSYLTKFLRKANLRDSRQGFGFQASWHAEKWPISIPIDHALVTEQIHVHNRFLGGAAGSDHLPLVVDISVNANR